MNITKHINKGIYSKYQIQKNDSFCAAYCFNVLYITQIMGFKKMQFQIYTNKLLNLIIEEH